MSRTDLILFGDGVQALYYDEQNVTINRHGVKVQKLLVVPSGELVTKYKLTEKDLTRENDDGTKGIWMEYPSKQIIWLNRSKEGAAILILCAFDGARTPLMSYYKELLEWDKQRDMTEQRLRAQVSLLNKQLEASVSSQTELLRQLRELQLAATKEEQTGDEE